MKYLLLIILLSSCIDSCNKNLMSEKSQLFTIKHCYDKEKQVLIVNVQLKSGMHAYALGEKIGKPVSLKITEQNGWKALKPAEIPMGKEKRIGDINSIVLDKNFIIKQYLQEGSGQTSASLFIQVCSDDFCSKPQVYDFLFPVNK